MIMHKSEKDFYRIGRVRISITDEDKAIETIKNTIYEQIKGYVCISTMRTVVIANTDDSYQKVMENSLMNTPDGTPLVWCGHWWGLRQVKRACGPHIFPRMLKMENAGLRHFLLGDTEEILDALKKKAIDEFKADVVGVYSPPFAPIEEYNFEDIAKIVNDSGANIVWTALRAPKQDFLNAKLVPYLNDGIVCVGVGAAFRVVLRLMPQPDGFIQKIGFAGLLFKRSNISTWENIKWYVIHAGYLIKYFFSICFKRLFGIKYYKY